MPLQPLKPKPSRIVGLDLSTNSIAYCLFVDKELKKYGEVNMAGTTEHRLYQANRFSRALGEILKPDQIAYESAVLIQNKKTVILLAMAFGAVISSMSGPHTETRPLMPIEWQNYIGNPKLNKEEKDQIKRDNLGKSANWYKNAEREFRKQRTMLWANDKFGLNITSDNISDCLGVGFTAVHK